jgi:hypothetical protein
MIYGVIHCNEDTSIDLACRNALNQCGIGLIDAVILVETGPPRNSSVTGIITQLLRSQRVEEVFHTGAKPEDDTPPMQIATRYVRSFRQVAELVPLN